jgi:hypothetical protein
MQLQQARRLKAWEKARVAGLQPAGWLQSSTQGVGFAFALS